MELPEEVLLLVREYAGPLLRYPGEYRKALTALDRRDWPLLKQHLSTPYADRVLIALQKYVSAFLARKNAFRLYEQYWSLQSIKCTMQERRSRWTTITLQREAYRNSLRDQDVAYRDLMIEMLGKETVQREHLAYVESDSDDDY